MATRTCERCTEPLAQRARRDARYCSGRCRVAMHRARRHSPIPRQLLTPTDGAPHALELHDDVVCLALPGTLAGGQPLTALAYLLRRLPATWVDVAPNGAGLHVWGTTTRPAPARPRTRGRGLVFKLHRAGDVVPVTGTPWSTSSPRLAQLDDVLEWLGL